MSILDFVKRRQSCRKYDFNKIVEEEKIKSILDVARLAPSAVNGQPYHITVCTGQTAIDVRQATMILGKNKFASHVPVFLVISNDKRLDKVRLGSIVMRNDFRSIDIGILAAYITAAATEEGLGTCIMGQFDTNKVKKACGTKLRPRLVIALGYPQEGYPIRYKKRKSIEELVSKKS